MSQSGSDKKIPLMFSLKGLDEKALAILGDTDVSSCTYPLGYVQRQPLYVCLTCNPAHESSDMAGVCLACTIHCHQGHDIVEIFTKRNFRCDCGNQLFGPYLCKLVPDRADTNVGNLYNHNFRGRFCVCDRPHQDGDDAMLQCVVCEDWFHVRHLGVEVAPDEGTSDLVCARCVQKHPFLHHCRELPLGCNAHLEGYETEEGGKAYGCVFLPDGWRPRLCMCSKCLIRYRDEGVKFLLDPEDTIKWYEKKGWSSADIQILGPTGNTWPVKTDSLKPWNSSTP